MSTVDEHYVEVYEATVVESDYWNSVGMTKSVGRCSCGWSVVRQLRLATENQVAKHRKEVAV